MPKNKPESKRVRMKVKYAVQKKVKEHDRKERRMAKKNPAKYGKKLRKDPGIPNLYPFKAQLLQRQKRAVESLKAQESARQQRLQLAAQRRRADAAGAAAAEQSALESLAAAAASRGAAYEEAVADAAIATGGSMLPDPNQAAERTTRRAFMKHLRTVVERADIILEVLDARDPMGCRSLDVERYVLGASSMAQKRLVLILNKIDLVPPTVVQAWLKYLRQFFPTIAFKASTQKQGSRLAAASGAAVGRSTRAGEVVTGSGAAGAETILQLVKNYSRSHGIKTAVTVGVVGYPNVGKSSLINSLKRSRVAGVSPRAGHTTTMQEIALDSKVKLLDCPGIIFGADDSTGPDGDPDGGASLLLRNCISVDTIDDPEYAVEGILRRCHPDKIAALYGVPRFTSTEEFLVAVAHKRNMKKQGGALRINTAAKAVLMDWNSGKIPFFTLPPADGPAAEAAQHEHSEIVSTWATEFDLDALPGGQVTVEGKPMAADTRGYVALASGGIMPSLEDDEDEDEEDEEDVSLAGEAQEAQGVAYRLGETQHKRRLKGTRAAAGTVAAMAAGDAAEEDSDVEVDGVAAGMGLGRGGGRVGGKQVSFLDPDEVAAGNVQVQAAAKAGAKADRKKLRKDARRSMRAAGEPVAGDAPPSAPTAQQGAGEDDEAYDFNAFF